MTIYKFEELEIFGEGLMAWGEAELYASCPDINPHEFYVAGIELDVGNGREPVRISRKEVEKKRAQLAELTFSEQLFVIIANKIEADQDAQEAWDREVEAYD